MSCRWPILGVLMVVIGMALPTCAKSRRAEQPPDNWRGRANVEQIRQGEFMFWRYSTLRAQLSQDQRERSEDELNQVWRDTRDALRIKRNAVSDFNQLMARIKEETGEVVTTDFLRRKLFNERNYNMISVGDFKAELSQQVMRHSGSTEAEVLNTLKADINATLDDLLSRYPREAQRGIAACEAVLARDPSHPVAQFILSRIHLELNQEDAALDWFERARAGEGLRRVWETGMLSVEEFNEFCLRMAGIYLSDRDRFPYVRDRYYQPEELDQIQRAYLGALETDVLGVLKSDPDFVAWETVYKWVQLFQAHLDQKGAHEANNTGFQALEGRPAPQWKESDLAKTLIGAENWHRKIMIDIGEGDYHSTELRMRSNLDQVTWREGRMRIQFYFKREVDEPVQYEDLRIVYEQYGEADVGSYVSLHSSYSSDWLALSAPDSLVKIKESGNRDFSVEIHLDNVRIPESRFPFYITTGGKGEELQPQLTCNLRFAADEGKNREYTGTGVNISENGDLSYDSGEQSVRGVVRKGRSRLEITPGVLSGTIILNYNQISGDEQHIHFNSTQETGTLTRSGRYMALSLITLLGGVAVVAP
jgi:hypothetical protein